MTDDYRETELGPLPAEWQVVPLATLERAGLLLLQNGFACGEHNQDGKGIPHIRPFNISDSGAPLLSSVKYVEPADLTRVPRIEPGDVVFNNTNSQELVGKTTYWRTEGVFTLSNHMTILRVLDTEAIDSLYLASLLHSYWLIGHFSRICRRYVNQASVTLSRLRDVSIPLPPLPEQRAIARVLDTARRAIEASEGALAALRELKRSLMQHLFTYGPVPIHEAERVLLKETGIGPVPQAWNVVPLGEVVTFSRKPRGLELSQTMQIPFIAMKDIPEGDGTACSWSMMRLDDIRSGGYFEKGDILLAKITPSFENGKQGLTDSLPAGFGYATTEVFAFRPQKAKAVTCYVFPYLRQPPIRHAVAGKMEGTTGRQRVPRHVLENLPIPLPPLPEQHTIAGALGAVDDAIAAEEGRKQALEKLFQSLLHNLMTGRVRAALDREPAEEVHRG